MRNPFKDPTLRKHFDGMVQGFQTAHRDVGTPENRCRGNSFAGAFWIGYDGVTVGRGNYSDRASRQTLAYACYRAGVACAAARRKGSV